MGAYRVKAIRKLRNEKGELVGYLIAGEDGATMKVNKEALKEKVQAGIVDVVNMTLTKDGRLLGKASSKAKPKRVASVIKLLEVYTNGRSIIGAMIDTTEFTALNGTTPLETAGLKPGIAFELGNSVMDKMKRNGYSNVVIEDNKTTGDFKKKAFKNVRNKLLAVLEKNGIDIKSIELVVEKTESRGNYTVCNPIYTQCSEVINTIIYLLICDTFSTEKIHINSINGAVMNVTAINIKDLRAVVKSVFKPAVKANSTVKK